MRCVPREVLRLTLASAETETATAANEMVFYRMLAHTKNTFRHERSNPSGSLDENRKTDKEHF